MTVKGRILVLHHVNYHQEGGMAGLPKSQKNLHQLTFQTEVLLFLNEGLWLVSEKFYLFFLNQDWEIKLKLFTALSKTRLSQFHLCVSVYSQLWVLPWDSQKTPGKGRALSGTLLQPLIHQPQVWEEGREIEVLGSVYRAGQDPAHPYPFSS